MTNLSVARVLGSRGDTSLLFERTKSGGVAVKLINHPEDAVSGFFVRFGTETCD